MNENTEVQELLDVIYHLVKHHMEHFERGGKMRYFSGPSPYDIVALRLLAKHGMAILDDGPERGVCAVLEQAHNRAETGLGCV